MRIRSLLPVILSLPALAQGYFINSDKPDSPVCPQVTIENDPNLVSNQGGRGATLDATRTYRWGTRFIPAGQRPDASTLTFYNEKKQGISIASLKGKIVIVGLWGYRCQPSANMLLEMAKVLKARDRYGFEVWAMNFDANRLTENDTSALGGWAAINKFKTDNAAILKDTQLPFGTPGVGDQNPGRLLDTVDSLPVMMVIDREGRLASVDIGYTQGMVGQRLSALIHEEQAAKAAAH